MILCSCSRLTRAEVSEHVTQTLRDDPYSVITPGRLFHETGRSIRCGFCCALVDQMIAKELARLGRGESPTAA